MKRWLIIAVVVGLALASTAQAQHVKTFKTPVHIHAR